MKTKFPLVLTLLVGFMFLGIPSSHADGITIGTGASLILNEASLRMGCLDITVENGGTLNLGGATIAELKNLSVNSGGIFITATGSISYCGILSTGMLELLLLE